jgi:hypothetical protein
VYPDTLFLSVRRHIIIAKFISGLKIFLMKYYIIALSLLVLSACSVQKRKYQRGYYVSWKHEKCAGKESQTGKIIEAEHSIGNKSLTGTDTVKSNEPPYYHADRPEANADNKLQVTAEDDCDNIIFKDGSELRVKILDRTPEEIKYKRCELPDGPVYTAKRSSIFMIKYANGTREVFTTESRQPQSRSSSRYQQPQRVQPMAVMALVFGILGIWPLTFIGSIVAVILGSIARNRIERQPEKYKGEGMAIAGQVLGIVIISIFLVILLIFLVALMLMAFI